MKKKVLCKIANIIIGNIHNTMDVGLFNGKMGLAIFFYEYAKFSGNQLYNKFADAFVDDVYSKIDDELSSNARNGIANIGIGLNYLLKNNFLEGESADVLCDIDKYLLEQLPLENVSYPPKSVYSSGLYLVSRLTFCGSEVERKWINNIVTSVEKMLLNNVVEKAQLSFINSVLITFCHLYKNDLNNTLITHLLLSKLLDIAIRIINLKQFSNVDIIVFKEICNLFPPKVIECHKCELDAVYDIVVNNIDLLEDDLWWFILYNLKLKNYLLDKDIYSFIDKKSQDFPFEMMSINEIFARIGLILIKN